MDFEKVQSLDLGLQIENVAPFVNGTALELGVSFGGGQSGGTGGGAGTGAGVGVGVGLDVDAEVDSNVDTGLEGELGAGLNVGIGMGTGVGGGLGTGGGANPVAGPAAGPGAGLGGGAGTKPVKPVNSGSGPSQMPGSAKSYPIKILVKNVPEGPAFAPSTKEIPLSEDPSKIPKDGIIGVFLAVDPDTGEIAEDVR